MFSLIISIIAIALVAALALASIYYGGDAFQEGTIKAEAATAVNQGQQIQGAYTIAELNGEVTPAMADLVSKNYLKEIPKLDGKDWAIVSDNAEVVVATAEICLEIEKQYNDSATTVGTLGSQAFGCYTPDGGTTHKAYYAL